MHTCKAIMDAGYKSGKAVVQGDHHIGEHYRKWAKEIISNADNKVELRDRFEGEFLRGFNRHNKAAIMDSFEARVDRGFLPESVLHNVYSRKIKQISSNSGLTVLVENEDAHMGAEIYIWDNDQWYKLPPIQNPIPLWKEESDPVEYDSLPDDALEHYMNGILGE